MCGESSSLTTGLNLCQEGQSPLFKSNSVIHKNEHFVDGASCTIIPLQRGDDQRSLPDMLISLANLYKVRMKDEFGCLKRQVRMNLPLAELQITYQRMRTPLRLLTKAAISHRGLASRGGSRQKKKHIHPRTSQELGPIQFAVRVSGPVLT